MDEKEHLSKYEAESESFLSPDEIFSYPNSRARGAKPAKWFTNIWIVVAVSIALFYIIGSLAFMILLYTHGHYEFRSPNVPYSPATAAITYVTGKSTAGHSPILSGPPSEEHDDAWLALVEPSLIRATYEEMQLGSEDPEHSVEMETGGGYLASLGVFHELHCLRRIKLYLHKEHYYPSLAAGTNPEENAYELNHLNHCIEAIRLSLMCAGNPALYSFQWAQNVTRKPVTKTNSARTCVDWSVLNGWSKERMVGYTPELKAPEWDER